MKIVEQYVQSKTGKLLDCEDSIFVSNDFVAVIDGVTSKSFRQFGNKQSGKASAILLARALEDLEFSSSAEEAIDFLTKRIFLLYKKHDLVDYLKKNPLERASASIIIYSKYKNEIWSIGDCQCLVDDVLHSNKKYMDELLANVRALFLESEDRLGNLKENLTHIDTGREFIFPLLKRQFLFQNVNSGCEFSYGVIDGFNIPKEEIKIISLSNPRTIILASDGYPRLFPTLKQSENYLNKILENDPLCYKEFKSTKGLEKGNISFDDRAYIKIQIR